MIRQFCLYALLRNLRFFDAFFVVFLLLELHFSFTVIGLVVAYEKALMGLLEIPLAIFSDRTGRRRALMFSFSLSAMAFGLFGAAKYGSCPLVTVFIGQTLFALAESLRTGTHKAMVLEWLAAHNLSHRRVGVLAQMRFFSKCSGGVAACVAGVLVWQFGQISILFWVAMLPSLAVVALVACYPRVCDGALSSKRQSTSEGLSGGLHAALTSRQAWVLLLPSILFESQIKLALPYLQPALTELSQGFGFPVLGGIGALLLGGYLALSGLLAGSAALVSEKFSQWANTMTQALRILHVLAALMMTITCLGFYIGHPELGLFLMLGLAAVQNMRRPLFVACIDEAMAHQYRATMLSIESQGRSWLFALASILVGWVTDHLGLWASFAIMACILWTALFFTPTGKSRQNAETTGCS